MVFSFAVGLALLMKVGGTWDGSLRSKPKTAFQPDLMG
jgi:hypothetical protein